MLLMSWDVMVEGRAECGVRRAVARRVNPSVRTPTR